MHAHSTCKPIELEHKPKHRFIYRTPWCEMLGCCSGETTDILHYYYPFKIVAEEVHMHTSYLGKHRGSEAAPHLLDLISMTQDERDLFYTHLRSAMAKVFTYIGRSTKNVDRAYRWEFMCNTIKPQGEEVVEYHKGDYVEVDGKLYLADGDGDTSTMENLAETPDFRESVHYIIQWPKNLNSNYIEPLNQAMFEALYNYVIWRWLLSAYPSEADVYRGLYEAALEEVKRNSNRLIDVVIDRVPRVF